MCLETTGVAGISYGQSIEETRSGSINIYMPSSGRGDLPRGLGPETREIRGIRVGEHQGG